MAKDSSHNSARTNDMRIMELGMTEKLQGTKGYLPASKQQIKPALEEMLEPIMKRFKFDSSDYEIPIKKEPES
jgi:hypothetical protein